MSTTQSRFGALLLAAALFGGACSDGGEEQAAENPKQALSEAIDAFGDYEGVTLEMSLQADPADVHELVETFEGDMTAIDTAVQQASAAGFDFAEAVAAGEWIGVEGLDRLAQQFGLPQATPDPEQAAAFAERLAAILDDNARVTSEGTDDVGAHLRVTVPLAETGQEIVDALQTFAGPSAGALPADSLEGIPDADVPVDVWVSDGRLVQIELDFIAIAEELGEPPPDGVDELGLRMTLDEFTGGVEAPEDFVEIDLQQILQGFLGAVPGSMETDFGESTIEVPAGDRKVVVPELGLACSDLEGLPPAQIDAFLEASGQPGAMKKVRSACPELF